MKINIIGAGKVGQTLGRLLVQHRVGMVSGVINQNFASAKKACIFIGEGEPVTTLEAMPNADMTFITTPDASIAAVVEQLVRQRLVAPGSILVHCSGAHPASILSAAKSLGVYIASVHPLKSFAAPWISCRTFSGTYCVLEGEDPALAVLIPLMRQIGARPLSIDPEQKSLYHSACVFASNYTVTLFNAAWQCFVAAGIESVECAKEMTDALMRDALSNINTLKSATAALTGPLLRGEADVLAMHLDTLDSQPKVKALYIALAKATLDLASQRGPVSEEIKKQLFKD